MTKMPFRCFTERWEEKARSGNFLFFFVFAAAFLFLVIPTQSAFAACTKPDGVAGEMHYNHDYGHVQYCDGTDWVSAGKGCDADWTSPTVLEITGSTLTSTANFGAWGAMAFDGNRLIVGAPGNDGPNGTDSGDAYIFVHKGGAWVEEAHLSPDDVDPSDLFGASVDIDGPYAIVGAYDKGNGDVYIFERQLHGEWWQVQKIETQAGSNFGYDVAIDKSGKAVVSSSVNNSDNNGNDSYYYVRNAAGVWEYKALIDGPYTNNDYQHLASAVDVDGDLVVAAGWENNSSYQRSVKLFEWDGAALQEKLALNWNDNNWNIPARGVALNQDYMVLGRYNVDTKGTDAGNVVIYKHDGAGNWTYHQELYGGTTTASDYFGYAVDIAGDRIVVGGHQDDTSGADAGSIYVFKLNEKSGYFYEEAQLPNPASNAAGEKLGTGVAIGGNIIMASAYLDDDLASDAGRVYVFNACGSDNGCINPDGTDGEILYNATNNVLQYCNGSMWVAMGPSPGSGGAGCSSPGGVVGEIVYNSSFSIMQYCDGTNWHGIGKQW